MSGLRDPDTSADRRALADLIRAYVQTRILGIDALADAILAAGFRRDYIGPTDPADLNPEPGYSSPGYSDVRHTNGSHK